MPFNDARPETLKAPATLDEAEEINPPSTVSMPVVDALERVVTPLTERVEERTVAPSVVRVPYNLELPVTCKVEEAPNAPSVNKLE